MNTRAERNRDYWEDGKSNDNQLQEVTIAKTEKSENEGVGTFLSNSPFFER